MDLYFERHDGQAVTTDDFVQAMADASGVDLTQFKRWYDHAGTPVLDATGRTTQTASVHADACSQSMNPPFHIPLAVKIGRHERVLSLKQAGGDRSPFDGAGARGRCPRSLRGFSAPVILNYEYNEATCCT